MKRLVCFILVISSLLSLALPACAYDTTSTAFRMMFLAEMQYCGGYNQWEEHFTSDEDYLIASINGNQYRIYIRSTYVKETGLNKVYELGLTGPYNELRPDFDPYTDEGSGYSFRAGLNVYFAFFLAVYDLGIMPDNENSGTFFEAGLLNPYGIYDHLTEDIDWYYDKNTWKSYIHRNNYLELLNYNGVRVTISGTPGGQYEVHVYLP